MGEYDASFSLPLAFVSLKNHLLYIIIFCHWMSCAWMMTAKFQPDTSRTWIDYYGESFHGLDGSVNGRWRASCPQNCKTTYPHSESQSDGVNENLEECIASCKELTPFQIYCGACYWSTTSITSVGYGDITPQNTSEMMLTTLYLLIGAFFWAFIIGNICALLSSNDPGAIEYQQTMDELNLFVADRNLPNDLRRRLRMFIINSREVSKNARQQTLVNKLSPGLRSEVQHNGFWIRNIRMFKDKKLTPGFLAAICAQLSSTVYEPNELVPWMDQLNCINRGVASRKGWIRTAGTCW